MKILMFLGGGLAGLAIPVLLLGILVKCAVLRLHFRGTAWQDFTPREALARRRETAGVVASALTYLYVLAAWGSGLLLFAGLIFFLGGYLPHRFG